MALITTTEKLKEYVPALGGIKEDEENARFVDYQADLNSANAVIKIQLLGATIYNKLNDYSEIKALAMAVEAYMAALSFIPQNDLILTESGFVVMSTNNQAPASKERVERLLATIREILAQNIENIQLAIEANETLRTDWQGVKYCSYFPAHICQTNTLFLQYAMGYDGNCMEYAKMAPKLMLASNFLIKKLGKPFYQDLIDNPASEANTVIINDVRLLFAAVVLNDKETIRNYTNATLAYLVANLENYPLFAAHYGTPEKWVNSEENRIVVLGAPRI